jgi:hypothetical protein
VTAQVEETPEGTRVTLRPQGAARWLSVGFLALWLVGWAAGEVFALGMLGGIVARALGWVTARGIPTGGAGLGLAIFLLFWSAVWTIGGLASLSTAARTGWGVDVFTIGRYGWKLRQGIGPWGGVRRFEAGRVTRVALQRRTHALIAEVDGKSVTLTQFGTEADRCALCERLRAAAGLQEADGTGAATTRRGSRSAPRAVPDGYRLETLRDGTECVTRSAGRRVAGAGLMLGLALFWNGIVSVFVLAGAGVLRVKVEGLPGAAMEVGRWGYWLFLTPFIAVGLGLIAGFVWAAIGREEWRLGAGQLEIRRLILGREWSRTYADGMLVLTVQTDSDGDDTWRLMLEAPGTEDRLAGGDPAALRALGVFLSERTGWTFRDREAER